jgi:hypothetical protein
MEPSMLHSSAIPWKAAYGPQEKEPNIYLW